MKFSDPVELISIIFRANKFPLEFKIGKIGLLSELMGQSFKHLQLKINSVDLNEPALNSITEFLTKNTSEGKSSYEIIVEETAENTHVKLQSKVNKLSITKDLSDEFEKMHSTDQQQPALPVFFLWRTVNTRKGSAFRMVNS